MILDILKKLVPASIRENEEQLMRSYVLLGIMLVNSTICFLGLVVFIFIIVLPPDIAWVGFSFVIGGLTGYAAIFWLFFITRSYFLASNAVIFMLIAMVYVAIAVTGGFEKSVMVQLCCLSPALAFLLTGLRAGTVWLSITCVLSGLSLFGSRVGIGYISLLPDEYGELMGVGLHFVLFFMIGGAIYLYEIIGRHLKVKLNSEKEKFREIATIATDSSVVTESADALAFSANNVFEASVQQKTAIEELVATIEHLNATAQQNNELAGSARDSIKDAGVYIGYSKQDVDKLLESMNQINVSSAEIQKINNVINEISTQTHLLSLNAMIEASRSTGESGGFRVVATEVGRLAERSAVAARDVNVLLENNLVSVKDGVSLTELLHQRFDELTAKIDPLILSIQEISNASFEQSETIQEITQALINIDRAVDENRLAAEETSRLAGELKGNAQRLLGLVGAF